MINDEILAQFEKTIEANKELSRFYSDLGHYDIALKYLQQNLEIAEATGSRQNVFYSVFMMACKYDLMYDHHQAILLFNRALGEFPEEIGGMEHMARYRLASCYGCVGDVENATKQWELAEKHYREENDIRGESMTIAYKAALYIQAGDFKNADAWLRRSKELCPKMWEENSGQRGKGDMNQLGV